MNKVAINRRPLGGTDKSISRGVKPVLNQRSVLDGKYSSGTGLLWIQGGARLKGLYKALLPEPTKAVRRDMTRRAMRVLRQ